MTLGQDFRKKKNNKKKKLISWISSSKTKSSRHPNWKKKGKLSQFTDNIIFYAKKNPKDSTKNYYN